MFGWIVGYRAASWEDALKTRLDFGWPSDGRTDLVGEVAEGMVRWGRLPAELPPVLLDFKRALRQAINNAGFANLGQLAAATGIPDSTLSDVMGSSTKTPTKATLRKILAATKSQAPSDSRYDSWSSLYALACTVAKDAPKPRRSRRLSDAPGKDPDGSRQSTDPVLFFNLVELRRLAGEALDLGGTGTSAVVGAHEDIVFESVTIRRRTATFHLSRQLGQRRVLLRLDGEAFARASDSRRFDDEAARAREVSSHPHVAKVVGAGLTELGHPFFIQLLDLGTTSYSPPLSAEEIVDVGAKLADALSYAHNLGATFGEIELSHILRSPGDEPVLTFSQLPILARHTPGVHAPQQDVRMLCAALLSMLTESQNNADGRSPDNGLDAQLREILLSTIQAEPQRGPGAPALRDRLNNLKREARSILRGVNVSASLTVPSRTGAFSTEILVMTGDLFREESDIVVGFSDTFDTATENGAVISSSSLQGQLLERVYGGDLDALDRDLDRALASVQIEAAETRSTKTLGKLNRYPIGTTAIVRRGDRRIFAVAVSRMGNDLIARSSYGFLQMSLGNLWEEVRRHSHDRTVAMPIIGSGLSRVHMSRDHLLREIISSFAHRSQVRSICHALRIVVHPSDLGSVDIFGVAASTLGSSSTGSHASTQATSP